MLKDVLDQVYRFELLDPEKEYRLLGVRWYAGGAFERERKLGKHIAAKELNKVEEGDFIYNRLFAWKGSFAVITRDQLGCFVSGEFPVFRAKADLLSVAFLNLVFSRSDVWKRIEYHSTGTTNISRNRWQEEQLLSWHISLPPLAEQRRIVVALRAIDEAVSASQDALERGRLAIKAFTGQFQVGQGFDDWRITPLDSIADIQGGISLSKKRKPKRSPHPYLRVANVRMGEVTLDEVKTIELFPRELERYALKAGDLLLVEGHAQLAQLGRSAIVPQAADGMVYQNHLFRIRITDSESLPGYVEAFINGTHGRRYFERVGMTTSGLHTVNSSKIRKMPIVVPPRGAQERLVTELQAIQKTINSSQSVLVRRMEFRRTFSATLLQGGSNVTRKGTAVSNL